MCGVESPAEQNAESERREPCEQSRLQQVRLSDCQSPDGDARKSLGRALRSWARMEGFLGCANWTSPCSITLGA